MSDQVIGLIREFGFPTVVVLWFMFRVERRLDRYAEIQSAQLQASTIIATSLDHLIDLKRNGTPPKFRASIRRFEAVRTQKRQRATSNSSKIKG